MVETFLESQTKKADYDPFFERKLKSHRLSASYEARSLNIWTCGDFATERHDEDDDDLGEDGKQKRSSSITNILPQVDETTEDFGAPSRTTYYKLSKAEKKRIKKDLLEFSKKKQGLTKENELRKNLIKTEEALEAKINEGSQASSILNDHRKNMKKVKPDGDQIEKQGSNKDDQRMLQTPAISNISAETMSTDNMPDQFVPQPAVAQEVTNEELEAQDEKEKKLLAKKLLSDKQK